MGDRAALTGHVFSCGLYPGGKGGGEGKGRKLREYRLITLILKRLQGETEGELSSRKKCKKTQRLRAIYNGDLPRTEGDNQLSIRL